MENQNNLLPDLAPDLSVCPSSLSSADTGALIRLFLLEQDLKENSKAVYSRSLIAFFKWVKSSGLNLVDMSRPDIIKYRTYLLDSGFTVLTVNSYLNAVRQFYTFCEANRHFPNIAKGIKPAKRTDKFRKQPLMPDQVRNLVDSSENLRNIALFTLLLHTGLRTVEAIKANVADITLLHGKRVLMVHGKGRDEKDDFVILSDVAFSAVSAYLKSRGNVKTNAPLFVGESPRNMGGRMTTRSISRIIKNALIEIGIDDRNFTAHSLRHTAGVSMIQAGININEVQLALRHASVDTTAIYLHTIKDERRLESNIENSLSEYYRTGIKKSRLTEL